MYDNGLVASVQLSACDLANKINHSCTRGGCSIGWPGSKVVLLYNAEFVLSILQEVVNIHVPVNK